MTERKCMEVSAEISMYPLGNGDTSGPITRFIDRLQESGLDLEPGPMSSVIRGECGDLFQAICTAFQQGGAEGDVVMVMKVSNACH